MNLSGQDFYLGPHGTKTSHAEYDRLVAEWLARGRRPISHCVEPDGYTVVELMADYKRFAEGYCRCIAEKELSLGQDVPTGLEFMKLQDSRAKSIERQLRKAYPDDFSSKARK